MKNLTKIFMAVAVALFALSCATDATEDLGIKVEGQGVTELTISLEESRTQLGDKVVNEDGTSLYPLYWSEGDAIAVNGVVSTPLASEAAGTASATFSFGEQELTYPYCVVYPAQSGAGEGTTYPVTFLATQAYTAGTFAPQAAPMYGYEVAVAEGEVQGPIQMQHLTGVLRLAVKGNGEKLTALTVAASDGKIAGDFTVDCSTGALTASESAVNTITVTLPEGGLELKADEATPIYIAVPAGGHGIYTITLVSDALTDNTMIARFNSDYHKVEAGVVKEFGEIIFTPNANNGEEGELVIMNVSQMKRLAQLSEVGQLGGITKVTVGATIDMSGETDWHGIELFPSIVFDGGSENGFEIKGLKAPLFGTTAATLQNIKLTDVNIVETERIISGAVACQINEGGSLTNCEASGTFEVNNTTYATLGNGRGVRSIGCMVGTVVNATITNCVNRINLTLTSIHKDVSGNTEFDFGGIVGAVCNTTAHDYSDLTNHGSITYLHTKGAKVKSAIGGIVGYSTYANYTKVYNHGTFTFDYEGGTIFEACIGGVFGRINNAVITTGENRGGIICKSGTLAYNYMGGIVGSTPAGTTGTSFDGMKNYGEITLTNMICSNNNRIGGVGGFCNGTDVAINNCENNGAITIQNTDLSGDTRMSGCVALIGSKSNLENLSNTGALSIDENCKISTLMIAGCLAYQKQEAGVFTNFTNNAPITVKGSCSGYVYCGGVLGYINAGNYHSKLYNYENGDLYVELTEYTSESDMCVGGVAVKLQDTNSESENHGDITIKGAASNGSLLVAGVVAIANNYTRTSCVNTGTFTIGAKAKNLQIGGIGIDGGNSSKYISCSNSGNINITEDCEVQGYAYIGGISSYINKATIVESSTNSGDITFSGKCGLNGASTNMLAIGGYRGYAKLFSYVDTFTNSGKITFDGTSKCDVYLGGVFGNCTATSLTDGTHFKNAIINTGDIACTGTLTEKNAYVGGIIGKSAVSISGAQVYCDINAVNCTGGMVTAASRTDAIQALNCKVGGRIALKEELDVLYDETYPVWVDITADNYFEYIYSTAITAEQATTDGCSFLTEKPSTEQPAPEDTTTEQ